MPLPPLIERALLRLADAAVDRRSRPLPEPNRLRGCKIISHRGEHDGRQVLENTLTAFEHAAGAGVWGIELDIRWTRDLEPVVFHDADLSRLFGCPDELISFSLDGLQNRFPEIPALAEVVARWGKRVHLMIEVKRQTWPEPRVQARRLEEVLHPLAAVQDFHLIALEPEILRAFSGVPPRAKVSVASGWPASHHRRAVQDHWGGICGHFLLLTRAMIRAHHDIGQEVGTGYARSRNCLWRELNRGVDWIFSNNAVQLQQYLSAMATARR